MARRDRLFSRACRIAVHRATCVGIGVRFHGFSALLTASFSVVCQQIAHLLSALAVLHHLGDDLAAWAVDVQRLHPIRLFHQRPQPVAVDVQRPRAAAPRRPQCSRPRRWLPGMQWQRR